MTYNRTVIAPVFLSLSWIMLGCASTQGRTDELPVPPIIRHDLSQGANDWEPSLGVGAHDDVYVIAGRFVPPPPGKRHGGSQIITWASLDGGRTFGPSETYEKGGADERIKVDRNGTVYASWIRVVFDSTEKRLDKDKGGLILVVSHDHGKSWQTTTVGTMRSGVGDKPELAVSPDGKDLYIGFLGPGSLDLVASHDGGSTWERHVIDSVKTMYWPTSIALAPNGAIYLTNPQWPRPTTDSVLHIPLRLLSSFDRGVTWRSQVLGNATVHRIPGSCVHGPTCPAQVPYPAVAVDGRDHVYLVYTEGNVRQPYALKFRRSEDEGATWSTPTVLSDADRPSSGDKADHFYPMIAASGDGLVYVAWFDDRDGPMNVWAKRSTDGGISWSPDVRLSRAEGMAGIYGEYGGIGVDAHGVLHVTWSDGSGHVGSPGAKGGTWYARWDGRVP
jgi:hypothetical protein